MLTIVSMLPLPSSLVLSDDIAEASKLCDHTKISTTQIYAGVLDCSKRIVARLMDAMRNSHY